jgi:O-antigen ligase
LNEKRIDRAAARLEQSYTAVLVFTLFSMPFSIALSQTGLALSIMLGLVMWMKGHPPRRTGLEPFVFAFVGWALLNIAFSQDPGESLRHAKRFLLLPALWLGASWSCDRRRHRLGLAALALGAAGVAVYGIIQYLGGPGGLAGRADLTQGYMTAGGIMMLCGLTLLSFLERLRRPRNRVLLLGALLLVIVALIFTHTRSAWIGFAAGTFVILLLRRPKLTPIFLLLLVLAGLAAPASFRARLLSSFDPGHPHNVQRVIMWRTGWQMMLDHPLTGLGDLDLKEIYRSYHEGEEVEVKGHLHSNYVMFGALWGLPGLVLVLLMLFAMAWLLLRRWRELRALGDRAPPLAAAWNQAALAAWAGFMIAGLFEWNFGDAEIILLFWFLVGAGLAPCREESSS